MSILAALMSVASALVHSIVESRWAFGRGEVLGGVIAGLIASAIAWGVGRLVRWKRNIDDFGVLAGEYNVYEKAPSDRADGTLTLKGKSPVLDVSWTLEDGSTVRGTLTMNEQSRVTGSGSYEHRRGSAGGWGDFSVHVASRKQGAVRVLVDGRFTDQELRRQIASAWVWEMHESPRG
jgi:hypothetical protein